ncbi:hypothetical protein [Halovivax gelatinilyticus]|uniref:hypothetical protein n=1 Tax=Halovivax gelatinilyticus TaxID=2961597 RepID=UPI0020CA79EA|nr:hypothetical protein [Halovivax gelatinilyticus]
MNLEELRSVRNTERQRDSLQELRPSFYQEVGEYIGNLEDERDRLAAESANPFSEPEVSRLTDEIETAKDVAEAVYERRMGKLVKQASLAAAGLSADAEGLTEEEQALFADLVERIESNKAEVLAVVDGADSTEPGADTMESATPPPPPDEPVNETAPPPDESGVSIADAMGSDVIEADGSVRDEDRSGSDAANVEGDGPRDDETPPPPPEERSQSERDPAQSEPNGSKRESDDIDRVTVQITTDVGSILGVDDREYTLASDDVVTLPEANADPLIERDAAKPLE